MTPQDHIARLDRSLGAHGEDVVLRRTTSAGTAPSVSDRPARAHVRGYQPSEIIGNIAVGDRRVILSPSGLGTDLPRRGDFVLIGGRSCMIEAAPVIRAAGEVVRIELQVRG